MFIVLEGIDGAGCGAQRKNIERKLLKLGRVVHTLKFPYYHSPMGEMLRRFLKEGEQISLEMEFLLFASLKVAEKEKIARLRKEGILISDRYFSSTLVYQSLKGFNQQKALKFANDFKIEIPDKIFYLDTPADIARERKLKEEGKGILDIYESDFEFTKKLDKEYKKLIKNQVFAQWEVIDNTKTIDEVSDDIIQRITKF